MQIRIVYHGDVPRLTKIRQGDWIDLCTAEDVELKTGEFKLIPLGVSMKLPEGYEAHMVPRSSTFKRYGILQANSFGVIDESYCGQEDIWHFPAYATRDTFIEKGTRICQFRIFEKMPLITFEEVEFLTDASRGGFGSTGY